MNMATKLRATLAFGNNVCFDVDALKAINQWIYRLLTVLLLRGVDDRKVGDYCFSAGTESVR